ncbi:MAG: branched-chain amino acid transport system II carrier protein [Simkaniaceae bacterium]|nr:branched-chain amino acid transport system II carrier protein [Simkaniaceae bacterium]
MRPVCKTRSTILFIGLTLFSLFFGAGNITFPLIVGVHAGERIAIALTGFCITAVAVPFLGLLATILFEGDYADFFHRLGKIPALILIIILLGIEGPFGSTPRLITLMFSTVKAHLPGIRLAFFSPICCAIIFLFAYKKNRIVALVGRILAPLLLLSLALLVVKGLLFSPAMHEVATTLSPVTAFTYGLEEGYYTTDLVASFFFASLAYATCRKRVASQHTPPPPADRRRMLLTVSLKGSLLGAFLLGLTYCGLGSVASKYRTLLGDVPNPLLIATIGHLLLGEWANVTVCTIVVLTCLTTAIGLAAICSDFLSKKTSVPYVYALIMVLVVTGLISSLEFNGICRLLTPLLVIAYPTLIVLCFINILHKTCGLRPVKTPFYATVLIALIIRLYR